MKPAGTQYKKLVLVCTNEREGKECCAEKGADALRQKLKLAVVERDPSIRVSRAGCLGSCSSGITVVIQPDNIWLGQVTENDIPELVEMICKDAKGIMDDDADFLGI